MTTRSDEFRVLKAQRAAIQEAYCRLWEIVKNRHPELLEFYMDHKVSPRSLSRRIRKRVLGQEKERRRKWKWERTRAREATDDR